EFDKDLQFLDRCIELYEYNIDNENIIHSLILKYKILCFTGDIAQAIKIKNDIQAKIDLQDIVSLKINFESIINNGTCHDRFINDARSRLLKLYEIAKKDELYKFLQRPLRQIPVDISDKIK